MNRKKMIKKLALLTAMLFVTFLLAGCGSAGVATGSIKVQVVEVVDQSESVLTHAIVGVQNDGDSDSGAMIHRQYSKPNGQGNMYVFSDLPPGVTYNVYAEAFGYMNEDMDSQGYTMGGSAPNRIPDVATKRVRIEDGQDYFMKVFLKKNPNPSTGHIQGVVRGITPNEVGATGTPLANATVILVNYEGTTAWTAVTDSNGYYMINNVPIDPMGFFLGAFAANDQGPLQIYQPLEPTASTPETGSGTESRVYLVPGDTVTKHVYLLKTIIEPNFTYEGVIQAMVETTDGLPLDTSSTPIFATIFKDGDPYTTVRVGEGGLIEFQSLPISPTGVIYDKINVTSSFITNSPQSITFSALLTEHTKNYSVETPITVTLKTGQVSVTVNLSWAAGVTGSPRANFQTNVEGAQSGQPISITRPQTTGQATFTNVPIGKRKITCTYQGMESTTQSLLVNFSSTEDEVTVSTGTSAKTFSGTVTVNN